MPADIPEFPCAPHSDKSRPAATWTSTAFGLVIRSDFPIDELLQIPLRTGGVVDLEIERKDGLRPISQPAAPMWFDIRRPGGPEVDELHWRDVGSFRIVGADRIDYDVNPGVELDLLTLPLLGTVMALVLHHKGRMVLHGSAVEIDGRAVVFVGDKGSGKSTTAASLVAAGHRILTDDIVALERRPDGTIQLLPGYGQVKLTQTATDAIVLPPGRMLDRPYEGYTKYRHVLDGAFDATPLGVSDIFVLDRSDHVAVNPLTGHRAILALMRYAYLTRFGADLFQDDNARAFLAWCADVGRSTRIGRLEVPSHLAQLPALAIFLSGRSGAGPGPPS